MKNNIEFSNNANIIHNKMKCIKYDCVEWKEGYHKVDYGSKNLGTSVRFDPDTGKQVTCMVKSSCKAWKTENGDEYRYKIKVIDS